MSQIGYHLRIRLESDRLIHCSPIQRRSLVRSVYDTTQEWLVLSWGCAGVHMHVVVLATYREAGELARRLEISLQRKHGYGCSFLKVHRKPLADQHHAFRSCLYDMNQRAHHDLAADPFLEATSLPDLVGARIIGAHLVERAYEYLPELRRRDLLRILDVDDLREAQGWQSCGELREAAMAAFALPRLAGRARDVMAARAALVAVAGRELSRTELADLCNCAPRTVDKLRKTPAPLPHQRAVRLQLDLRHRVRCRDQAGLALASG